MEKQKKHICESARIIQVIETKTATGQGIKEDPLRYITQYWSMKGELLAEIDPIETQAD